MVFIGLLIAFMSDRLYFFLFLNEAAGIRQGIDYRYLRQCQ